MNVIDKARKLRPIIEEAMQSVDDKTASEAPTLFPFQEFKESQSPKLIHAGHKINWKNEVLKAVSDLWDIPSNSPEKAPALWVTLDYFDGIRKIPNKISVSLAFAKGERGYRDGKIYESVADNNVFTPEEYPENWRFIKNHGE